MRSPEWQAEVDELQEQIRTLQDELTPPPLVIGLRLRAGLTLQEARVVAGLVQRGYVAHEAHNRVAMGRLQQLIKQIRKKLGEDVVRNIHGYGYTMPDAERGRIRQLVSD